MATTGDPIDPRGTKRPNKGLILESTHTYKLILITKRPSRPYLPLNIYPDDLYAIFSLFFTDKVLNIIIKNINVYKSWYY